MVRLAGTILCLHDAGGCGGAEGGRVCGCGCRGRESMAEVCVGVCVFERCCLYCRAQRGGGGACMAEVGLGVMMSIFSWWGQCGVMWCDVVWCDFVYDLMRCDVE